MIVPDLELGGEVSRKMTRKAFLAGLTPDPEMTVSDWADEHRTLDQKESVEPGRWRTDRTPYLREIMDTLSTSSPVRKTVFRKGSQVGGTEVGNNFVGYVIDHAPGPMMLVLPTEKLLKRANRQRIEPLLKSPRLAERVGELKSRDASNTMLSKDFPGGILVMASATSPSDLRSMPLRFLFLDEVDAFEEDLADEGDPVELAQRGTKNFKRNRKVYITSTPTVTGRSRIDREFQNTDRRFYHVPCPYCGTLQRIDWGRIKWERRGENEDKPKLATELEEGVREIWLECENLDCTEEDPDGEDGATRPRRIHEHHKPAMLEAGVWIPEDPTRGEFSRGYHLSALYSPFGWFSWGEAAGKFVQAQVHGPTLLKVWVNQVLGEPWIEKTEAPDWRQVWERAEPYTVGIVPEGGCLLTMGVDVQANRLELEVVAWGEGRESWSVDYRVLPGSPQDRKTWTALAQAMGTVYPCENGAELGIALTAIDSGYETNLVYQFARTQPPSRCMAVKGTRGGGRVMVQSPVPVDVTIRGRRVKRGTMLWPVDSGLAKEELYAWLKLERPIEPGEEWPPGYCHFPQYGPEHFKQLCSEQLVAHRSAGRVTYRWEKRPGQERNETLDCRVYARCAAAVVGIDRWSAQDWKAAKAAIGSTTVSEPEPRARRKRSSRWPRTHKHN